MSSSAANSRKPTGPLFIGLIRIKFSTKRFIRWLQTQKKLDRAFQELSNDIQLLGLQAETDT